MNHSFYLYPVVDEVVVLIKILENNEMLLTQQRCYRESTYCQSTDTERHMWAKILTVQYLLGGDHKIYNHVLTSNSTNTKHISGE